MRIEDLKNLMPGRTRGYCNACFTGKYDIPVPEERTKSIHEKKISKM